MKLRPQTRRKPCVYRRFNWRRGSESNEVFTGHQPQYPDLQGYFNAVFAGVQGVFVTIRHLSDLTRHAPATYSVIEEIVEGFIEGFCAAVSGHSQPANDSALELRAAGEALKGGCKPESPAARVRLMVNTSHMLRNAQSIEMLRSRRSKRNAV